MLLFRNQRLHIVTQSSGGKAMSELDVRVVELEPNRVASVHAFSASPEHDALEKLIAWAKPRGLLDDPQQHRIFGFNNPDPSPGSPNYGYEFWIVVGPDVEPEGEVKIKEFPGGLYAVTRCDVQGEDPGEVIPATWKRLIAWCEDTKYRYAHHQWLEEHTLQDEDLLFLDLYCPIAV
jgi:DNA gyrase inhibitor GyrI